MTAQMAAAAADRTVIARWASSVGLAAQHRGCSAATRAQGPLHRHRLLQSIVRQSSQSSVPVVRTLGLYVAGLDGRMDGGPRGGCRSGCLKWRGSCGCTGRGTGGRTGGVFASAGTSGPGGF
jgi:hypothetical protein